MSDFSTTISQWNVFYATTAGVSATLLGLLFVGITFRIDVLRRDTNSNVHSQVLQTYWGFAYPLLTSFVFLMPNQTPSGLGIPLLAIGVTGVLSNIQVFIRLFQRADHPPLTVYLRDSARIAGYFALIYLAALAYQGQTYWLYFMGGAVLWLLGTATSRAFALVMDARPQPDVKPGDEPHP
ncbi:MAG TPA: hypothetical protein VKQ72_11000 [Aggregatilineales bacterium]|nr:hypothetical protein [Aggregatilineales bacterium]